MHRLHSFGTKTSVGGAAVALFFREFREADVVFGPRDGGGSAPVDDRRNAYGPSAEAAVGDLRWFAGFSILGISRCFQQQHCMLKGMATNPTGRRRRTRWRRDCRPGANSLPSMPSRTTRAESRRPRFAAREIAPMIATGMAIKSGRGEDEHGEEPVGITAEPPGKQRDRHGKPRGN